MRKGENIYKRKDGRWEARYSKGRDDQGRIIYGFCYGKTYTEAKSKMENAKKETPAISSSKLSKGAIPSFGKICDEWIQCNRLRLKQSTCVKYQTIIDKHIRPVLGSYSLSEISTAIIGQFGSDLINVCGLAPKTAKDILVLVHSVLEYGSKYYPGTVGTVEVLYPKKQPKEMRVLSRTEQKILTDYLLADLCPCKFGVLLALWTGMRIGEVCALQWKHISLKEQSIRVDATMQRLRSDDVFALSKTKVIFDSPKTASSMRIIPISDRVTALCRSMYSNNQNAYILTGTENFMEPRLLQYHFHRYISACGLKDVTFHTLRHTFATRCVEVDFEIKSLSEILGHANTAITLNRYVHCSMELKRENMKKLESLNI